MEVRKRQVKLMVFLKTAIVIVRGHPHGGEGADPKEEEALQRLRESLANVQREEALADQHLLYVQEILKNMSEDDKSKRYIVIIIIVIFKTHSSTYIFIIYID